jgi:hypothetical protein
VTSKHNALHEQLTTCQAKCLGLKQDVATQQQALQEAFMRAIEAKKNARIMWKTFNATIKC